MGGNEAPGLCKVYRQRREVAGPDTGKAESAAKSIASLCPFPPSSFPWKRESRFLFIILDSRVRGNDGSKATMKYPAYPEYKDSGVQWLGQVPEHWEVKKLKMATHLRDKKVEPDEEKPVPYIGMENIESWTGKLLPIDPNVAPSGVANRFTTRNTLFGKLRPYLAKACNPDFDGLCSTELLVLESEDFDRRALLYWLLADGFIKLVDSSTYGSKMPRANWNFIGNCLLPLPPLSEQTVIADFLDQETGRIDRLTAKKRQLIALLGEKRAALISRTITRGLPAEAAREFGLKPHTRFKNSGIEWLGQVPERWRVTPLFRIAETIQTGPFGSQLHSSDYVEGGIPLINPAHINAGRVVPDEPSSVDDATAIRLSRHRFRSGDVVMGRRGEIGRSAVIGSTEVGWLCGTGSLLIRLRNSSAAYFSSIISGAGFSSLLELNAVGTTMLNLNPNIVGRMLVPVPPFPEQTAIAAYLDRETAKIDQLITKIEAAIACLQEYRTALITAAVTGKIDVRGTIPPAHTRVQRR